MCIVEDAAAYTPLNIGQHRFSMSCIWIMLRIWKHDQRYPDYYIIIIIIIVIIQYYLIILYV
jgi:hypothetical protein